VGAAGRAERPQGPAPAGLLARAGLGAGRLLGWRGQHLRAAHRRGRAG
jgi:hypothetical protein